MRTTKTPVVVTHAWHQEALAASSNQDHEVMLALVEKFKQTPVSQRMPGQDIVCVLLRTSSGKDIFFSDEEWRDTLTVSELNHVGASGVNVLQLIASDPRSFALIDEDKLFRRKITAPGFCMGMSRSIAYRFLTSRAGVDILQQHAELVTLFTTPFLNQRMRDDIMPVLYEMVKTKEGTALLSHPDVRARVTEEGLNACGIVYSTLSFLMRHEEAMALWVDDAFRLKLRAEVFNKMSGHERQSPLMSFCQSAQGCEHIANYVDLAKKINFETFTTADNYKRTPAFHLARSKAGVRAYAAHKRLFKLLDEYTLNLISTDPADRGASLLFWLLVQEGGAELLAKNLKLFDLLSVFTLRSVVSVGEHEGLSLATLLLQPEQAGLFQRLSSNSKANVREAAVMFSSYRPASNAVMFPVSSAMEEVPVPHTASNKCIMM